MKLITKAIASQFPALYETDGVPPEKKLAIAKFFGGSSFTFYAFEANAVLDDSGREVPLKRAVAERIPYVDVQFFGYVSGVDFPELTYMNLSQLAAMRFPPFGLGMERDLHFRAEVVPELQARAVAS